MKEKEEKERVRKSGIKHGTRSQKMASFRLDNDLELWLNSQPNKGRYINELIRKDRELKMENLEKIKPILDV